MGVADFPIETLKLLNIHPDSSRKGKGKAKQTDNGSTAEATTQGAGEPVSRSPNADSGAISSNTSNTPDIGNGPLSQSPAASNPTTPRAETDRCGFMAQALAQSSQVSHSRSPSRDRARLHPGSHSRRSSQGRSTSASNSEVRDRSGSVFSDKTGFSDRLGNMDKDSFVGTGKGVGRIVGAGFKSPLDFSMGVAQGFHNVPKLYGGDVRQVEKVTNLQSGLKVAAKVVRVTLRST